MYVFVRMLGFGLLFSASVIALGQEAQAAEAAKANLDVSLEIAAGCSIGFGSGIDGEKGSVKFPTIINLKDPLTQTVNLNIQCSKGSGIKYKIGMNPGMYPDGDYKKRRLQAKQGSTVRYIDYNVYKDAACQKIWGPLDSSDVMGPISFPDKDTETYPVCVKIPAQPKTALYPGVYTDTVTAEISY